MVVFSRIVILMSFSKLWLGRVRKCLYIGRLGLVLEAALCPPSLMFMHL